MSSPNAYSVNNQRSDKTMAFQNLLSETLKKNKEEKEKKTAGDY